MPTPVTNSSQMLDRGSSRKPASALNSATLPLYVGILACRSRRPARCKRLSQVRQAAVHELPNRATENKNASTTMPTQMTLTQYGSRAVRRVRRARHVDRPPFGRHAHRAPRQSRASRSRSHAHRNRARQENRRYAWAAQCRSACGQRKTSLPRQMPAAEELSRCVPKRTLLGSHPRFLVSCTEPVQG